MTTPQEVEEFQNRKIEEFNNIPITIERIFDTTDFRPYQVIKIKYTMELMQDMRAIGLDKCNPDMVKLFDLIEKLTTPEDPI